MGTHGTHPCIPWVPMEPTGQSMEYMRHPMEFVGTPGVHDESMIVGAGWGGFGKRGEVHGEAGGGKT